MRISGAARLAGIMGWPVAHSRSPLLHSIWLEQTNMDGAYLPLPVKPEHLEAALRALPILGFRGCNLTIPHKQSALSVLDKVEPLARRIGAVNGGGALRGLPDADQPALCELGTVDARAGEGGSSLASPLSLDAATPGSLVSG